MFSRLFSFQETNYVTIGHMQSCSNELKVLIISLKCNIQSNFSSSEFISKSLHFVNELCF